MRFRILVLLSVAVSRGLAQASGLDLVPPEALGNASPSATGGGVVGRNTALLFAGTLGMGVAVSLLDSRLLPGRVGPMEPSRTSSIGDMVGGPGPVLLGASLYAAGRGFGNAGLTNVGREVIRAVAITGGFTAVTKGVVGRSRPFASPGDADEYSPGRGFLGGARSSFPSGHTAAAFAAATVLTREIDSGHPRLRWAVGPTLFGAAAFVGWSRLYDRQHWPSDVLVGSVLGTVTGYEVVAHARGDRSPFTGAFLSHLGLSPGAHGLRLGWSLH